MITAIQARENAALSDSEIERHLKNIGDAIERLSKDGKRQMYMHSVSPYDTALCDVKDPGAFGPVELTALQLRIKERLGKLGFGMRIESEQKDRNKCFGSMADSNDEPDLYMNHTIVVSW